MTPAIDVVVVFYSSRDTLRACVEPLAELDEVSVIVVDNASADQSLETIAALQLRTVASEHNRGFGAGCNSVSRPAPRRWRCSSTLMPISARRRCDGWHSTRLRARCRDSRAATIAGDGALVGSMRRYQRAGSVWAVALFVHQV